MKALIINETCGIGSHGKICIDIAKDLESKGYEVKIAHGRDFYVPKEYAKYSKQIGNKLNVYVHGIESRLFDNHGLSSRIATKKFLRWAKTFNPDLVWLHNIHGYYINYKLLFEWLKKNRNIQIKWTLHDCWAFTGHCAHFTFSKCDKWKTGCFKCPNKKEYPSSLFVDNSRKNYKKKKECFTNLNNLEIICPSQWLKNMVDLSFLNCYKTSVKNNKIDKSIFRKKNKSSEMEAKFGVASKFIILGVSSSWSMKKGLYDFYKLANSLDSKKFAIILIGLDKKQIKNAPDSIIALPKTSSPQELADFYNLANIFINPTYEDTYPTVNLEATACGTKVITYDTGGCKETIDDQSYLVKTGDLDGVIELIHQISNL